MPAWPRVLVLVAGLLLVGFVGWIAYTNSTLGQCHGQEREVAEFRFGISLKQMMNLPIHEQDRERFDGLCRMYQAKCYRHLDGDARHMCRPI
ncbi:MAG: hypothetical protein O2985_08970 [Proteobacteria bacterium]|nr:hypothetical protein [Pseudomonadota bacterium]